MDQLLAIIRENGMRLVGQPEEFHVGDYHRYTIRVRRSLADHDVVIEIYPSSRAAAPMTFELPRTSLTAS